jgi:hypothetical protein
LDHTGDDLDGSRFGCFAMTIVSVGASTYGQAETSDERDSEI